MKKKLFGFGAIFVLLLAVVLLSLPPLDVDAATCTHAASGDTCTGMCCKTTLKGCIAGPCSVVFPTF